MPPGNGSQIRFPYRPPTEYDFTLEFTANPAKFGVHQLLTHGDVAIDSALSGTGDDEHVCRLMSMAKSASAKGTVPFALRDGHRYVTRIEVRNSEVRGYVDDELKISLKTDYRDFEPAALYLRGDRTRLGLAQWWNTLIVYRAEVVEVTGRGTVLTDSPREAGR